MSDARGVVYVIDLNESRNWGDCAMCGHERRLDHAVGWCCGPTHDEIGSASSEYRDMTVGGMCVCKGCHDGFYRAGAIHERERRNRARRNKERRHDL